MENTNVWEVSPCGYSMDFGNGWKASYAFGQDAPEGLFRLFGPEGVAEMFVTNYGLLESGRREASKIFLRNLDRLRSAEGLEGIGAERMIELYNSLDALERKLKEGWGEKVGRSISRSWKEARQIASEKFHEIQLPF